MDKLGEIGEVLKNICEAVKTSKLLHQKNGELNRVIGEAKKQTENVEELNIENEPLLHDLKRTVRKVRDHGSKLETWLQNFISETDSFEKFVKQKVLGAGASGIPAEVLSDFCDALQRMHMMATGFSDAFEKFIKHLSGAQEIAAKLMNKLKTQEEDKQKQADSARNKGAAGTVGLVAAGVGLLALGFLTGGAAWVAAGAVAGAACGVGAATVGVRTAANVKEMRAMAGDIQRNANKLDVIAKGLKSSCDRAGTIQMDGEAIESLRAALDFFRRDNEKDEKIAQLEAKLRSLGH